MIRVGEFLDAARRRSVVALAAAAIGGGREQLARERVAALAPGDLVTAELAVYVERLLAIAVDRCAVCLEPGPGMHAECAPRHAAELERAIAAGAMVRTIHAGGKRRRR